MTDDDLQALDEGQNGQQEGVGGQPLDAGTAENGLQQPPPFPIGRLTGNMCIAVHADLESQRPLLYEAFDVIPVKVGQGVNTPLGVGQGSLLISHNPAGDDNPVAGNWLATFSRGWHKLGGEILHQPHQETPLSLHLVQAVKQDHRLPFAQCGLEECPGVGQLFLARGVVLAQKVAQVDLALLQQPPGVGIEGQQDGQRAVGLFGQGQGDDFQERALAGPRVAQDHHSRFALQRYLHRHRRRPPARWRHLNGGFGW